MLVYQRVTAILGVILEETNWGGNPLSFSRLPAQFLNRKILREIWKPSPGENFQAPG